MDFERSFNIDRRGTNSAKWDYFGEDVLPMWVADMEFAVPPSVVESIQVRLAHPVFGYQMDAPQVRTLIAERMAARYGWTVDPDWIVPLPGLVFGLNMVVFGATASGDAVLMMPPIYPPFFRACENFGRAQQTAELTAITEGHLLRYEIDFARLEAAVTPETRLLLFCNPHNPTGRVFTRAELERVAELCLRHDLIVCSDEIHSDLVYSGHAHIPIAMLSPEIAARTITLIAPSKTFNIPGLGMSAAIIQDADLRRRLQDARYGFGGFTNVLGYAAAEGAYRDGHGWLAELLVHLEGNRDYLADYMRDHLPQLKVTRPEGTYLAWVDCRALGLENPARFFLEQARVAFNDGAMFGAGGAGFIRINFGCSRAMLHDALERMRTAIAELGEQRMDSGGQQ